MPHDPVGLLQRFGSPLYVYDLDVVRERARALRAAIAYRPTRLLYAMKANPCPAVVRALVAEGFGVDAVSPGELALAARLGLGGGDVLFTENSASAAELADAVAAGVVVNCGSLRSAAAALDAGARELSVRVNPEVGASEHAHTLTAGPLTKFGIHHSQVDEFARLCAKRGARVVGCHMHIGSNVLDAGVYGAAMQVLLSAARRLRDLRFIDFGGGLGVPYKPGERPLDLAAVGRQADALMDAFCADYGRPLELLLEPGRFLVAEAGALYVTVTDVKERPAADGQPGRRFVGCDSGFNHLVRPCMYGSYHPIANVSRPDAPPRVVDVVGNICESGDVFARDRALPDPTPGDVLAIGCAGAYGMSMASTYNLRPLPAEVVLDGGRPRLVRPRQTVADLLDAWDWDA